MNLIFKQPGNFETQTTLCLYTSTAMNSMLYTASSTFLPRITLMHKT